MPLFLLFSAITALLLTSIPALRAAPADELIAMGDTFHAKLQATEALNTICPQKSSSQTMCAFWRISRANTDT